jgi:hypothetical protein
VRLVWGEWELREGRRQQRVIQPDAVLELPRQGRRYFLECEMGTHTIAPRGNATRGATLAKAERYQVFLAEASGVDGRRTHYQHQYSDGLAAEVLFLVRSPGRAASVNAALAAWRAKLPGRKASALRALTFADAADKLRALVGLPPLESADACAPARAAAPEGALVSPEDVALLRRYVQESVMALKRARAVFRSLRRPDLPEYPGAYESTYSLLERLGADVDS